MTTTQDRLRETRPGWGFSECEKMLLALRPAIRNYDWMWTILGLRARKTGTYPPRLVPLLRRFGNPRKPYFVGTALDQLAFLGDYRDSYSVETQLLPDLNRPMVDFVRRQASSREGHYVDVGANMGLIASAVARELKGRAKVYAFEPVPETTKRAAVTFALNGLDNVTLFPVAVSDTEGEVTFFSAPGNSAFSSFYRTDYEGRIPWSEIKVACHTLDSLLPRDIGRMGFLKLDVEGHEFSVLKGARGLVARDQPDILFEYNPKIVRGAGWNLDDICDFLKTTAGYTFQTVHEDGCIAELTLRDLAGEMVNIYCRAEL